MASPGGRKATREQAREHESRAWGLRQQGWTQERIALEMGVDQSTVSRALARVSKRVLEDLEESAGRQKAEQSAQLAHLADEAMRAWRRSLLGAPAAAAGRENDEEGTPPPAGDPRFLEAARKAYADLRGLWGLDAPKKVAPVTPDGESPYHDGTLDDLAACEAAVRAILGRYYGAAAAAADDEPGGPPGGPAPGGGQASAPGPILG